MKNIDWDKAWIGFCFSLVMPIVAFAGYYLINYRYMTIPHFINYLRMGETYTPLISLSVLANLLPFYLFINKERYAATKGVIGATFLWAALIIGLKFMTE